MTDEEARLARRAALVVCRLRRLDRELSEDVASEVVLEMLRQEARGGTTHKHMLDAGLEKWAMAIARNKAQDAIVLAKRKTRTSHELSDSGLVVDPRGSLRRDDLSQHRSDENALVDGILARDILVRLTPCQQEAIEAVAEGIQRGNLRYPMASEALGISPEAAWGRVHRARRKVGELLEGWSPQMSPPPLEIKNIEPPFQHEPMKSPATGIILHATAGSTLAGAVETLHAKGYGYHYLIDKDGSVHKGAPASSRVSHAGESTGWAGRYCNHYALGVSFVNENLPDHPLTEAQLESARRLIAEIKAAMPSVKYLSTHAVVSPGRKTDPIGFPLEKFGAEVELVGWRPKAK